MSGYSLMQSSSDDHAQILDFLNEHFVPYEPINSAINLCEVGYRMPYFDAWITGYLEKEDSLVITARGEQEELLGLVIIQVEKSTKLSLPSSLPAQQLPRHARCPEKLQKIFNFLSWLKKDLDIEKEYKVDQWGDIMVLACRSDIRIPGLGTALIKEGVRVLEERDIKVFTTTATSAFSSRIFEKLGFQEVGVQKYEEYKVEGEVVFPTTEPHSHARQFVRS